MLLRIVSGLGASSEGQVIRNEWRGIRYIGFETKAW